MRRITPYACFQFAHVRGSIVLSFLKNRCSLLIGAALVALSATVDARAQNRTPGFNCCHQLTRDNSHPLEHAPSDKYGHAIYRMHVEAATIASVTLTRTDGVGEFDIEVVETVSPGTWHRANVSGLIARDTGSDARPNVVLIPPSLKDRTVHVHIYVAKNAPGKWHLDTRSVDLVEAAIHGLGAAGAQHLVDEILGIESGSSESRNVGRAIGIGFSIVQGKSIAEIGINAVVHEIQLKLQDEFPNSKFIVLAVTNVLSHTLQHLYGPLINGMVTNRPHIPPHGPPGPARK
jgi:hypothetical protein